MTFLLKTFQIYKIVYARKKNKVIIPGLVESSLRVVSKL